MLPMQSLEMLFTANLPLVLHPPPQAENFNYNTSTVIQLLLATRYKLRNFTLWLYTHILDIERQRPFLEMSLRWLVKQSWFVILFYFIGDQKGIQLLGNRTYLKGDFFPMKQKLFTFLSANLGLLHGTDLFSLCLGFLFNSGQGELSDSSLVVYIYF